ncbi:MAG: FAD-dependent oxidoreductase [Bacteriovoracaceae bacterium]
MTKKKIAIIGNGIAANTFLFLFLEKMTELNLEKNYVITQFFDEKMFPNASENAGAVVSTFGAERGLSPLGDVIVDSFKAFKEFSEKHCFDSVRSLEIEHITSKSHPENIQKFKKRFSNKEISENENFLKTQYLGYSVDPKTYLQELKDKIQKFENCELYTNDGAVVSIENESLRTFDKNQYFFDKLINCSGAYGDFLEDEGPWKKKSFGSYLDIQLPQGLSLDQKLRVFVFNNMNVIYKPSLNLVRVGATTLNEKFIDRPFEKSKLLQNFFSFLDYKKIEGLNKDDIDIQLVSGIRAKGKKRMPFWGEVKGNHLALTNLYKNGIMYAVLGSREILKSLLD